MKDPVHYCYIYCIISLLLHLLVIHFQIIHSFSDCFIDLMASFNWSLIAVLMSPLRRWWMSVLDRLSPWCYTRTETVSLQSRSDYTGVMGHNSMSSLFKLILIRLLNPCPYYTGCKVSKINRLVSLQHRCERWHLNDVPNTNLSTISLSASYWLCNWTSVVYGQCKYTMSLSCSTLRIANDVLIAQWLRINC